MSALSSADITITRALTCSEDRATYIVLEKTTQAYLEKATRDENTSPAFDARLPWPPLLLLLLQLKKIGCIVIIIIIIINNNTTIQ